MPVGVMGKNTVYHDMLFVFAVLEKMMKLKVHLGSGHVLWLEA